MNQRLGVVGPKPQRAVVARQRFVRPLQLAQCIAAMHQRLGVVGPQRQRAVVACQRLVIAPQCVQDIAEVVERRRAGRVDAHRLFEERNRGRELVLLRFDDTEQMKGVEVHRHRREDPTVKAFGLHQVPLLMQFDRASALGGESGGDLRRVTPLRLGFHGPPPRRSSARWPRTSRPASRRSTPVSIASTAKPCSAASRSR